MAEMRKLEATLRPEWREGTVARMAVSCRVSGSAIPRGGVLCTLMDSTVNIPFCPIDGSFEFRDDAGPVPFTEREDPETRSFVRSRSFLADREVSGDLLYAYAVFPRVLPEGYTSSPYFDFRSEPGGVNGAGLTFLAVPDSAEDEPFLVSLLWDLSKMPEGSRGVWSLGSGNVTRELDLEKLRFSYYAAGMLNAEERGDFGIYWFGAPPFDIGKAAERIRDLFAFMSSFFGDTDAEYRIFARRDPFEKSGGGTAAARSFMFGYSEQTYPTVDSMQNLLSHEMVHNWPHIPDEPPGTGTWYCEGMAEYYSVALPYRAGLSSLDDVCAQIVSRSDKYYLNPMRELSNDELARLYWTDRRTQRVPYGRGFFYIANTDAAIRRATGDSRSVDDVVMEILRREREGEKPDARTWLELVSQVLGQDAYSAFNAMAAGALVVPDPDIFGGAFEARPVTIVLEDTGAEAPGYRWSRKTGKTKENTRI